MHWIVSILVFVIASLVPAAAQDWPYYGYDSGGSRFSPLTEINTENVDQLERAWTYRHGDLEKHPDRRRFAGFHATPILTPEEVGRSLVLCSPFHRIIALDPATGEERWSYDPDVKFGQYGTRLKCLGVAQWRDQTATSNAVCSHRIFAATSDRRLISVDARDGVLCPDFGNNGQVDVNPIIAASLPKSDDPWGIVFSAPPVVVGDVIVLGAINNMKNDNASAPNGSIRAFDARTGEYIWSFDPIPRNQNDPQAENWTEEALAKTGGGNSWSLLSVDQERDLVFIPTSSASSNFYGGTRPGDNRYANSVVALRGSTGELVWHFQTIHHDVWDWDVPAQPLLVDITRDGETIPVVVVLTKQGLVFVFHRETGQPFFPIEERAVPVETDVPGEVLSPPQPFPVKPPSLLKTGITPDDAWGVTLWDKAQCREVIENSNYGPIYTPPSLKGWLMYPSSAGGMNWGGGAFDPTRNLLVTNVAQMALYLKLMPQSELTEEDLLNPSKGAPMGPPAAIKGTDLALEQRIFLGPFSMPCTAPPWSTLVGVDLAKGEIKWRVPLGLIDKLSPVPLPFKWGTPLAGGPIVTAGGLVFIGSTGDSRLRAFDTETGDELWVVETPRSSHAAPMTYVADGRQFVVIASGGHMFVNYKEIDDYLVAYALPKD